MKIRMGFVSNSSTSSFYLYGAHLTRDKIKTPEILQYLVESENWPAVNHKEASDYLDRGYYADLFEDICLELDLEYACPPDNYYLGKGWEDIGDDETGRQFKDRVAAAIHKFFPGVECANYSESWHD